LNWAPFRIERWAAAASPNRYDGMQVLYGSVGWRRRIPPFLHRKSLKQRASLFRIVQAADFQQ
jgi:hypothetical protein